MLTWDELQGLRAQLRALRRLGGLDAEVAAETLRFTIELLEFGIGTPVSPNPLGTKPGAHWWGSGMSGVSPTFKHLRQRLNWLTAANPSAGKVHDYTSTGFHDWGVLNPSKRNVLRVSLGVAALINRTLAELTQPPSEYAKIEERWPAEYAEMVIVRRDPDKRFYTVTYDPTNTALANPMPQIVRYTSPE